MPEPIVIAGCGGHGREILGVIRAINDTTDESWKVLGFVDDNPSRLDLGRVQRLGAPYLGPTLGLDADAGIGPGTRYIAGIGSPPVRRLVAERLDDQGLRAATLIHPDATVGADAVVSVGVVVFAGARVTTNVTLGRHVHLNQNVTIGHDSVLDDYVSVNPLAAVSGGCRLETGVLVGTTAAVLQGLRVGEGATVGAGACVVRDVPPHVVVKGVPAR